MKVKLSDIATIYYGKDYKKNPDGDNYPIYGTGGIMGYTSEFLQKGPAILSGRKGSINNPFYIEGEFWNVDTIFCIKSNEDIDTKWLYYNFCNTDLTKLNEATGVPSINSKSLYKISFDCPPLPIQEKIAKILSTCDEVIAQTEAAIEKYKAIKQGMMQDLFTRGIDPHTNRIRPTPQQAPELYKESELGLIPKEWEVDSVQNNSSLITNGFVGVATPYYTKKGNGVAYLFGTNIRQDKIDLKGVRFISKEFHLKHQKSQLQAGDMLTVQSGHIGTSAVVPDNFGDANCHALIITRFNKSVINSKFVSSYFNSEIGIKQLEKLFIGSTIKHINTSDLAKHLIPIPIPEEQEAIIEKLESVLISTQTEEAALAKYQQLKAGLMQDLLTGKVEVSEGLE
jgi:type I restriction enzyme S subunit